MRFRLLALLAGGLVLAAGSAAAQTAPGFDCAKAGTAVEKAICADPALSWLDHTLVRLFAAVQAGGGKALRDSQRAWLAQRDACPAEGRRTCLSGQYMTRLAALAAGYDKRQAGGVYAYLDGNGRMTAVPFPDGSMSVRIDTVGAPPGQPVCVLELEDAGPVRGGSRWTDPDAPMGDDQHCSIEISLTPGGRARLQDHGCQAAYCGRNGSFAGAYRRD
jgi:uncharacterized protein